MRRPHHARQRTRRRFADGRRQPYREEIVTDRGAGTVRVLTPLTRQGAPDPRPADALRRRGADPHAGGRAAGGLRDPGRLARRGGGTLRRRREGGGRAGGARTAGDAS
ncbi:MAG: hypothetical protein MZW92_63650 [Comamonadaceae bacterium]|nr:hypothetical protein [Comamonadaceae bacterium]